MGKTTRSEEVEIRINGQQRRLPADLNLVQLVDHLELKGDRIAIEVNREIVRRDHWADCSIRPGDVIEIVHFVGGGSY
jgi:sulfur carrier protein